MFFATWLVSQVDEVAALDLDRRVEVDGLGATWTSSGSRRTNPALAKRFTNSTAL